MGELSKIVFQQTSLARKVTCQLPLCDVSQLLAQCQMGDIVTQRFDL
jgi:hypothetical protein